MFDRVLNTPLIYILLSLTTNSRVSDFQHLAEAYSEPSRTYKMELFAKVVNRFHSLSIFAKCSILDVRLHSERASTLINSYNKVLFFFGKLICFQ